MSAATLGSVFCSRRLLLSLAVGVPILEETVLLSLGLRAGQGLAVQASALGPFGTFHDLRWLFVFHDSVLGFAVGLAIAVAGRALLAALLVAAAWPETAPRPRFRVLAGHAVTATVVAALLLSPWVTLLFGAALMPVSWVFFAAVPAALLTILLIHHGGIDRSWWRRLPPLRSAGWIGASVVVFSLVALVVAGRPAFVALPSIAAGGMFNAWAWRHSVRSIVLRLPARHPIPVPATVTAVAVLLAVVVGGARIGFASHADVDAPAPAAADEGSRAVLLVPGFASACCGEGSAVQAASPGLLVEQFSYLGLDERGRPRPHTGDATDADLAELASAMDRQVDAMAGRTGTAVAIVAESEGTLVVSAYLDRFPDPPVDRVMLLSPIVQPGRVNFPDPGEEGRGMVAGMQLRALTDVIDELAPFSISIDGPLGDSVRRDASWLHAASLCDRPAIDEIAILPLADAVTNPPGAEYPIEVVYLPGFHGGLRGRPDVQTMIGTWVEGGDIAGSEMWNAVGRVISDSASAWQVPALDGFAPGPNAPPCPAYQAPTDIG